LHGVKLDSPEVVADVLVPCYLFNCELFDVVATERDVAHFVVACEVEREHSFVEHALLVSKIDEQIRSIVTDFYR